MVLTEKQYLGPCILLFINHNRDYYIYYSKDIASKAERVPTLNFNVGFYKRARECFHRMVYCRMKFF
jgi:hypothetical protein